MASLRTPESQVVRFESTGSIGGTSFIPSALLRRRHTPYTKTPRTSRHHGQKRLEHTPVDPEDLPDVQNLLNKTWNVYQVTPMNDFKMSAASLKKYSRHLSAFLQAESQKGIGVEVTNEMVDRAVFSLRKGFKTSPDDSEAIELTVKAKSQGTNSSTTTGVMLTAMLCSVGADIGGTEALDDRFALLPVLMVKGLVGVTKLVIRWLESQFDCRIEKLTFNSSNLAWTIALWAGMEGNGIKPVEMQFTVPKEIRQGLDKITLTIEQQDAQKLWQSIHDQDSDITGKEVATFIKALEEHFFHHFKIHLGGLTLNAVGTPLCYIGCEGKIKIFQEDGAMQVIQHFTEMITEKMFVVYRVKDDKNSPGEL